ncbi:hypothetical protein HNW13_018540 [Shewanella sp. BF02_Schw]|uniref:hypothetical protein n=1 Tax=Shewanella sp. BF02_Schw TaxID=394908 RepID=UPI0017830082|nr:hypothetical protein [Shewanella sp. BF02_Schw]MBO1897740.1 hypothetical protein [Shewanella sp. BF02_Schw]
MTNRAIDPETVIRGITINQTSDVCGLRVLAEEIQMDLSHSPENTNFKIELALVKEAIAGWDRWARIN